MSTDPELGRKQSGRSRTLQDPVTIHTCPEGCGNAGQNGRNSSYLISSARLSCMVTAFNGLMASPLRPLCAVNIDRRTFWVRRNLNKVADYMAKLGAGDFYSYMLRPELRDWLDLQFGIHSLDRCASQNNVQVRFGRYYSKFYEPAAEGLDAFSCHWTYAPDGTLENNWVHPPYALLGRVLRHILQCNAQATLIAPQWPSASWWSLLASHLPRLRYVELADVVIYPPDLPIPATSLPRDQLLAILAIRFTYA